MLGNVSCVILRADDHIDHHFISFVVNSGFVASWIYTLLLHWIFQTIVEINPKIIENHWNQWSAGQINSMVMVQGWQTHWKTIDARHSYIPKPYFPKLYPDTLFHTDTQTQTQTHRHRHRHRVEMWKCDWPTYLLTYQLTDRGRC